MPDALTLPAAATTPAALKFAFGDHVTLTGRVVRLFTHPHDPKEKGQVDVRIELDGPSGATKKVEVVCDQDLLAATSVTPATAEEIAALDAAEGAAAKTEQERAYAETKANLAKGMPMEKANVPPKVSPGWRANAACLSLGTHE